MIHVALVMGCYSFTVKKPTSDIRLDNVCLLSESNLSCSKAMFEDGSAGECIFCIVPRLQIELSPSQRK